jgi:uncharacterized membrane protein YukC
VGGLDCAPGEGRKTTDRKIARVLADLEDLLAEEGLSDEQAEKLVNAIERKIGKALDELDGDDDTDESDDPEEPSA